MRAVAVRITTGCSPTLRLTYPTRISPGRGSGAARSPTLGSGCHLARVQPGSLVHLARLGTAGLDTRLAVERRSSPAVPTTRTWHGQAVRASMQLLRGRRCRYETVQVSTSVKEIAPRLLPGLAGANLSFILISRAVSLGNGLAGALAGQGASPQGVSSRRRLPGAARRAPDRATGCG